MDKKAIKESIDHWERMINWASNQTPTKKAHATEMLDAIGEIWNAEYEPLCLKYGKEEEEELIVDCKKCPLALKYGDCENEWKKGNEWMRTTLSKTWGEWTDNAYKFLDQLLSLVQKVDK